MTKRNKKSINGMTIIQIISISASFIAIGIGSFLLLIHPLLNFTIRMIIMTAIILLFIISIGLHLLFKKKMMKKALITTIIFSFLLTCGVGYLDYIYLKAINTLDKISVSTDDYLVSYIYVPIDSTITDMKDLKSKTIGLQSASNITTNEMIVDGLKENGVESSTYTQEVFSNYNLAADALLIDKSIDAIALDESAIAIIVEKDESFLSKVKIIATFKKQQDTSLATNSVNTSKEPFVALISGVDTRSGDLNQAANSDVIMLAVFNPQTMKLSLISIPRDSYIPVTCRGGYDKITHSGNGGISCTIASLEKTFNIDINYYLKINFFGVIDAVDAIGGIDLNVPSSSCTSSPTGKYVCIDAGFQTLNGEEALSFARNRKTLLRGDIDRGANQQLVIQAMIRKLASGKVVTSVDKLLGVLGNNVQTNMKKTDMYGLFSLLSSITANSFYGDASALQISSSTISGFDKYMYTAWAGADIYYFIPYDSSLKAVTAEINRILGKESYPLPTNSFAFNANYKYGAFKAADPIGNPNDTTYTAPLMEDGPEETATINISSNSTSYSYMIGDTIPSASSIIKALGIKAKDSEGNNVDVTLSLDNVNWNKEGSYVITATSSSGDIVETKQFNLVVYASTPTPIQDTVTIKAATTQLTLSINNPIDLISAFGLTAKNQHGDPVEINLSHQIKWNEPGTYSIIATALYNNVSDVVEVTLIIEDTTVTPEE